jgi:hypothetical protein
MAFPAGNSLVFMALIESAPPEIVSKKALDWEWAR